MFFADDIIPGGRTGKMIDASVQHMSCNELVAYLGKKKVSLEILNALRLERIDGEALMILSERDMNKLEHKYHLLLGDMKRFLIIVSTILDHNNLINNLLSHNNAPSSGSPCIQHHSSIYSQDSHSIERISPANSVDADGSGYGRQYATCIQPDLFKTTVSLGEWQNRVL